MQREIQETGSFEFEFILDFFYSCFLFFRAIIEAGGDQTTTRFLNLETLVYVYNDCCCDIG